MDKIIETDCISVILNKVRLTFFKFKVNRLDKGRLFSQNHLVCDVTIILSVEEFHINIFEI